MGEDEDSALETLRSLTRHGSAHPTAWLDANALRAKGTRRRRRRLTALGATTIVVAGALVAVSVTSPSTTPPVGPSRIAQRIGSAIELASSVIRATGAQSTAAATALATAETGFSVRLLQSLMATADGSNVLVSPFSLDEALAMVDLGADGETATQLDDALGVSSLSAAAQSQGWRSISELLAAQAKADHVSYSDADSIWTQRGFPVEAPFLDSLTDEFDAGIWQADFATNPSAASAAIDQWVSRATLGTIRSLLSPAEIANDVAVLLNAVAFKAPWAVPFSEPIDGVFHASSANVHTPFVSSSPDGNVDAVISPSLDAVQVPYWSGPGTSQEGTPGKFAALLVMPTSGTLAQFVAGLSATSLASITSNLTSQALVVRMPTLQMSSSLELIDTLESLGVTDAFGVGADFSGFSQVPTYIDQVKQDATLRVTQWGTVATAATAIGIVGTSTRLAPVISFNRPYLFLIRDTTTGAILFASAVTDPAASM